jgi:hypothetical protein
VRLRHWGGGVGHEVVGVHSGIIFWSFLLVPLGVMDLMLRCFDVWCYGEAGCVDSGPFGSFRVLVSHSWRT